MKVSGFSFLRNGEMLNYPFVQSIRSILPIVDEFVVALGPCQDRTEAMLAAIGDPKIRVIKTTWNENIDPHASIKGFVYAQQKSIALFNCTGDWAFYLEGDEVIHEDDLPKIRAAMEQHLDNPNVEALVFDYIHFYGNTNTYAWSPAWYKIEPRIIRNTIPCWASEGLFFMVLESHKKSRYPKAAHSGARIFHYGWARGQERIQANKDQVEKYWGKESKKIDCSEIDPETLRPFTGTHPKAVEDWRPKSEGLFKANPAHQLTSREKRHRWVMKLERLLGMDLSRKHYTMMKQLMAVMISLLMAAGSVFGERVTLDGVAAFVNDAVITVGEVNEAIGSLIPQLRQVYDGAELEGKIKEVFGEALDDLVNAKLIMKAYEADTKVNKEGVDKYVEKKINEFVQDRFEGDRQQFLKALRDEHMSMEEWRRRMRERIIVGMMKSREVDAKVVISPKDVLAAYQGNPEKYHRNERVNVRVILIHGSTNEVDRVVRDASAKEALAKIRARLRCCNATPPHAGKQPPPSCVDPQHAAKT